MCIPLLYAVLGPIGVFYGSAYIAVFNVIIWTYGIVLIIGAQMSGSSLLEIWRSRTNYLVAAWRLLIVPLIILGLLAFWPLDRTLLIACVIPTSAPVAATTALFATRFRQNTLLATHQISMTTILSIITMPLMILLADLILMLK